MNDILKIVAVAAAGLALGYWVGRQLRKGNEEQIEDFKEATKEKAQEKVQKAADWARENKEVVIAAAPIGLALFRELLKKFRIFERALQQRREQRDKDLRIFDRSTGRWLHLKRKMDIYDQIEFDERKRSGQTTTQILKEMGLLA